ncbi:hypothetical protein CPB83DRAFT_24650 [Crepidotus variabilis]|uniref:VASt domain-containing protein n=1 Tax=Crepidotus variabilis TaxID=179855 RepID=A0A9P6JVN2_9AGAR|nr:hypothetical protein CPB83DRAFT_24650 [Crepidotus variabilis]
MPLSNLECQNTDSLLSNSAILHDPPLINLASIFIIIFDFITHLLVLVLSQLSLPIYEITALEKKMTAFVIPNAIQITTRQAKYTFTSFLSRDTTFDVIYNIWRLARPEDGVSLLSSGRGSMDGPGSSPALSSSVKEGATAGAVAVIAGAKLAPVKKATVCACGREGRHYPEVAMEVVVPGTPEKINGLMFASAFMKDFMVDNQKLFDIQMSDWAPLSPGSKLLTRNMSYIKPLAGSLGPKQTKCEIKDETDHMDFDDYVSTVTTTRTPDVPSGGVFSVKTRTCVMWASPVSSKVVVTTQVEWTGRSFIKGIIERSAIDGQKVYHTDLEKAMRSYIQEHQTEFLPEGVEVAAVALTEEPESTNGITGTTMEDEKHQPTADELKRRERERNARGLQWAWDTFDGAYQVAKRSTKGALELIRDCWDQSTSTTILCKADAARKLEVRKVEEQERWVQSIVTALWDEMAQGKNQATSLVQSATSVIGEAATPIIDAIIPPTPIAQDVFTPNTTLEGLKAEVKQLQDTLSAMEERVKAIREGVAGLEKLNHLD